MSVTSMYSRPTISFLQVQVHIWRYYQNAKVWITAQNAAGSPLFRALVCQFTTPPHSSTLAYLDVILSYLICC